MIFARWTFLPLLLSLKNKDYDVDDCDYDDENDDAEANFTIILPVL